MVFYSRRSSSSSLHLRVMGQSQAVFACSAAIQEFSSFVRIAAKSIRCIKTQRPTQSRPRQRGSPLLPPPKQFLSLPRAPLPVPPARVRATLAKTMAVFLPILLPDRAPKYTGQAPSMRLLLLLPPLHSQTPRVLCKSNCRHVLFVGAASKLIVRTCFFGESPILSITRFATGLAKHEAVCRKSAAKKAKSAAAGSSPAQKRFASLFSVPLAHATA